ncbi:DUF5682 family protein [uncultured Cytophaga sp.]|uniref:DUF5682 family protein n=1 Tax=uncultured Cytophaga sp. TaxID=160238 RepID=UPI00261E0BD4|nr:DUF5682 family protein [uncultured Cytophaga sp.]
MAVHILGIRHHGPGSAQHVKAFLELHNPDIVLVEGPPDADAMLDWIQDEQMKPPVALLLYQPEEPARASFYPFAEFSPEWQALQYAKKNNRPVRFMDLPLQHVFALQKKQEEEHLLKTETEVHAEINTENTETDTTAAIHFNPLKELSNAAGFAEPERWWEHQIEYRKDHDEVFEAIGEVMGVMRTYAGTEEYNEQLREAYMRKIIREAEKELFASIVVICGAWHVPALTNRDTIKQDTDLLKGLPKVKIATTWTPWTYSRLSASSGYGAGIQSPGWYHHIWEHPEDTGALWMIQVARLLREKQMDVSVASVIEAFRLAENLAILRGLSKPGLEELNEATISVLCQGESIRMSLINTELIVSNRIGTVPDAIPKSPLQTDIEKQQKTLRLTVQAEAKEYTFDLRKEFDLERSVFLHRLLLLGIEWGKIRMVSGKGTFKEQWILTWNPSFVIQIAESANLGNTLKEAAVRFVEQKANETNQLTQITQLLKTIIPADLPNAVQKIILKTDSLAASSSDVFDLMLVIPKLVTIVRYGNVRNTDEQMILNIVRPMIIRMCVNLPSSCMGMNEDAASEHVNQFQELNNAVRLLNEEQLIEQWQKSIIEIIENDSIPPLIKGYCTRIAYDFELLPQEALEKVFYYALSTTANETASWIEGFLKGAGTILLLDNTLWNLLDQWVGSLSTDTFQEILPLLRRTFSEFTSPERRKLGEKAKDGNNIPQTRVSNSNASDVIDQTRGMKPIPTLMQLFGIDTVDAHNTLNTVPA